MSESTPKVSRIETLWSGTRATSLSSLASREVMGRSLQNNGLQENGSLRLTGASARNAGLGPGFGRGSGQPRLAEGLVGADHPLELVLRRAVAAIGVRVAAFDQLGIAGANRRGLGVLAEIEVGQCVALQPAEVTTLDLRLGLAPPAGVRAEHVEGIGESLGAPGELGAVLAGVGRGLEVPGGPPAGDQLLLLATADLALAHAGEEVPV